MLNEEGLANLLWMSTDPARIVGDGSWEYSDCEAVAKIVIRVDGMMVHSSDELNMKGFEVYGTIAVDADGDVGRCGSTVAIGEPPEMVWHVVSDERARNRHYFSYPVRILQAGSSL